MSEENANKVPEQEATRKESFKDFLSRIRKEHKENLRAASVHMIETFLNEVVQLDDAEVVRFITDHSTEDLFRDLVIQTKRMYNEGHFNLNRWKKASRIMAEDIVDGKDYPDMIIAISRV